MKAEVVDANQPYVLTQRSHYETVSIIPLNTMQEFLMVA
jgi:hypothetical protein